MESGYASSLACLGAFFDAREYLQRTVESATRLAGHFNYTWCFGSLLKRAFSIASCMLSYGQSKLASHTLLHGLSKQKIRYGGTLTPLSSI